LVADDERAALRELTRRGLTPLSLSIAAQASRGLRWRKRGNLEDHIRLINELAVLIGAGVNLSEAVSITSRSTVHAVFGDGLNGIGGFAARRKRIRRYSEQHQPFLRMYINS